MISRHGKRRVGAILSFELLLVLPVFMLLLFGMIVLSTLLAAEARFAHASREGARVAALGGDLAAVEATVAAVLGDQQFQAATVTVTPDISSGNAYPSGTAMEVLVTIPAPLVVPDLTAAVGFSIRNQTIAGRTVMRRE